MAAMEFSVRARYIASVQCMAPDALYAWPNPCFALRLHGNHGIQLKKRWGSTAGASGWVQTGWQYWPYNGDAQARAYTEVYAGGHYYGRTLCGD
jgi:hypothetical protein